MDAMKRDIAAKIISEMLEKLKGLDDNAPDASVSISVTVTELKLIAKTLIRKYELREFESNPLLY